MRVLLNLNKHYDFVEGMMKERFWLIKEVLYRCSRIDDQTD